MEYGNDNFSAERKPVAAPLPWYIGNSRAMPAPAHQPQLMPSLGRLVRGLSALFWGLPVTLIVCFYTVREGFRTFGVVPSLVCTGLLAYGVWQLGDFQKQERVWRAALDRARLLSLINLGLSPFLYWCYRVPESEFFQAMVLVMTLSGLLFLGSLNQVLQRLGAMLPDEGLRLEIRQFTSLNLLLLLTTLVLGGTYWGLSHWQNLPVSLRVVMRLLDLGSFWLLVLLVLLPMAMTMALLWKTKEVILENVFGPKPPPL